MKILGTSFDPWPWIWYTSLVLFLLLILYSWWTRQPGSTNTSWSSILDRLSWEHRRPLLTSYPPSPPPPPSRFSSSSSPPSSSKGEEECRRFLEYFFQKPFPRIRPPFLRNPVTGQCLELDCFNQEIGLAVEYNGSQHYHYNPMMHQQSKHSFQNQQYRDYMKQQMCQDHGIHLIVVPFTKSVQDIPAFLYSELTRRGFLPLRTNISDSI